MTDEVSPLATALAVLARWGEAFATGDPIAMVEVYAHDCLHYGGRPSVYVGRAGVKDYFSTLAARRHQAVRFEDVLAHQLTGGTVHLACRAVFTVDAATRVMRLTQTLTFEEGIWKVASHHASPMPT